VDETITQGEERRTEEMRLKRKGRGIIPTTHALTHMTPRQAEFNAYLAFGGTYLCAGTDGVMSVYRLVQILGHLSPPTSPWIWLLYTTIGIIVALFAIIGIRYGQLRKSGYAPTINNIRENPDIQGDLAQQAQDPAIIEANNTAANRIYLICWGYAFVSNLSAFCQLFWTYAIGPFVTDILHAGLDKGILAIAAILFAGGISYGIPWMGHIGEVYGFHFWEYAEILTTQQENVTNRLGTGKTQAVLKP